jgi:hypothetical protein
MPKAQTQAYGPVSIAINCDPSSGVSREIQARRVSTRNVPRRKHASSIQLKVGLKALRASQVPPEAEGRKASSVRSVWLCGDENRRDLEGVLQ